MKNMFRFTSAVVLENIVTVAVSLIYSSITGAISRSSLAAAGVCNQATNLIITMMNVMVCGATLMTAWNIGRNDRKAAARVAETALLCTPVLAVVIMTLLLLSSTFVMKLIMPGAEDEFLREGTQYFRMMLWSLPALMLANTVGSMLRAAGDSRTPMTGTAIACAVQLAGVWLFTTKLGMGISGAGLAIVLCRVSSAAYQLYILFRHNRMFTVRFSNVLKPDFSLIKRMCRLGLPNTFDGLSVQAGYVIINSMLVAMGTTIASVVNVLNTVLVFTGICQAIGSNITTALTGQRTGAGLISEARRGSLRILGICEGVSLLLSVPVVLFPSFAAELFAKDAAILEQSAALLWLLVPHVIVAVGVNVTEPTVRVSGDVRYTMTSIMSCVWLIRLPLTYLFCFVFNMGAMGVYGANIISLLARTILAFTRILSPKFGLKHA